MIKRKRRSPAKKILLSPNVWVRSGEDIKIYRKYYLKRQNGCCAVTKIKLKDGVLDHCHTTGRCRGVLDSQVNMLEGRFLKLFNKSKIGEKYNISFEDFLISLGMYLKNDYTKEKLHYKFMDDFRKQVTRWKKDYLLQRLEDDFNMKLSSATLVKDLVQMYVQNWVYAVEKVYKNS